MRQYETIFELGIKWGEKIKYEASFSLVADN